MGNCINSQAVASWADEEGEWENSTTSGGGGDGKAEEKERLLAQPSEVKIKITKKQLEELLRRAGSGGGDGRRAEVEEALARLIISSKIDDVVFHEKAPHWRPALQSIPEAAE